MRATEAFSWDRLFGRDLSSSYRASPRRALLAMSLPQGCPPPPTQPPGTGHDSIKWYSLLPVSASWADILSMSFRAFPRPWATATLSVRPSTGTSASFTPSMPLTGRMSRFSKLASGNEEIGGAECRFHDAAGGAEDGCGARVFAEGIVGRLIGHVFQIDTGLPHHAGKLPRREHIVDILIAARPHLRPLGLEFLRGAGHDGNRDDLLGRNALRSRGSRSWRGCRTSAAAIWPWRRGRARWG